MANPSEATDTESSKGTKRDFSSAILEIEKSPNPLVVGEDDDSVVSMHPDTPEKLQLARSDTVSVEPQQAISRVAVAQICEGLGFEGIKHSALDALSDITAQYMGGLAQSARYYANLAGRSESNVFDIVKALEDLSAARTFMDPSTTDCSASLKELVDYISNVEEIPFAHPISKLPVSNNLNSKSELQSSSEDVPSLNHVPNWLPKFPEAHTYMHSPMWNERRADRIDSTEHVRQRRKAESSLLRLQQRFLGIEGDSNPDLQNEVLQVSVPTKVVSTEPSKKHGSFVDVFGPVIDAVKSRDVDLMEVEGFEKRRVVDFRLKRRNKMRSEDVDVSLRVRVRGEGRVPCLGADEERDEKKRRAEQILRQAMASALENGNSVN